MTDQPIEKRNIPASVRDFLKLIQENISLYPETVVYNRIKEYIPLMTPREVGWLTNTIIVTTEFRVRIFKTRCDSGDDLACDMLDLSVNGDPHSRNETVQKGLMGLWQIDNDIESGKLLVELGRISQEELDRTIKSGRDKELIGGKTREEALCDLAAEAREYKSGDEFSMAMIMGRLKKVPEPNTKNVMKIIQGKYMGGDEFWAGVHNGDLDELCKRVKEEKEVVEAAKRKRIVKPELTIPEKPITPAEPVEIEIRKQPPTTEERSAGLDLMEEEIRKRVEAIKRSKKEAQGKAGEPGSEYRIKKKVLTKAKTKEARTPVLIITGTESRYSAAGWLKTPVSASLEEDQYAKYLIYHKGKGTETATSYHAKTYKSIYVLRYQGAFGYAVELGFTDEKNNSIKIMLDPAPHNIINGIIFENEYKIAEFDVDESSFLKAEKFARENNVIKELSEGYYIKETDDEIIQQIKNEQGRAGLKGLKCTTIKSFHKPGYTVVVMKPYIEGESIGSISLYDINFRKESGARRLETKLKTLFKGEPDGDLFDNISEDCTEWTYGEFESFLPGLESREEKENMRDCIDSSERLTSPEKETLKKQIGR